MSDLPTLITERLVLRGPLKKDIQALYQIHSDYEVMQFYGRPPYDSIEKAQNALDWLKSLPREEKGIRWIITLKGEDTYIGDVGFYDYHKQHNRAEIGYILAKEHWGKGIMTEAIKATLTYGFNEMNYNRLQALVDPRNIASRRVIEKHGFRYEGTFRDYEYQHSGYVDLDMYSILKREFI